MRLAAGKDELCPDGEMGSLESVRRLDRRHRDVVGARDLAERVPFPDHVRGIGEETTGIAASTASAARTVSSRFMSKIFLHTFP